QTRHATADDDRIERLTRVGGRPQRLIELLISNPTMRRIHDFGRVAVRAGVVANPPWPGPFGPEPFHPSWNGLRLRGAQGCRRPHAQQRRAGADQRTAHEVATRDIARATHKGSLKPPFTNTSPLQIQRPPCRDQRNNTRTRGGGYSLAFPGRTVA